MFSDGHPAPAVSKILPTTVRTTQLRTTPTPTTRTAIKATTSTGQPGYRYQQVRLDRNIHNAGWFFNNINYEYTKPAVSASSGLYSGK